MSFFSEFTTNIVLKPIVIFPKIDLSQKIAQFFQRIYTKYNVDFTRKMTLAQNIIAQNDILNQNNNYPTNEILWWTLTHIQINISKEIEVFFYHIWHFVNVYKPLHKKSLFF